VREVPVVTVFLLRRGPGGDRVLLLRRSGAVGTYRGRWAGVSGYLEDDPLRQAMREVAEETGLGEEDVRLVRAGAPVHAPDPRLGRLWVVYPFLMQVRQGAQIRLDWEHVAARWVRPASVFLYPTVPRLPEALSAVYPLVPAEVEEVARTLAMDRRRGAGELAMLALTALREVAQKAPKALRAAACLLARARPGMPGIAMAIAHAYAAVRPSPDVGDALSRHLSLRREAGARLVARGAEALPAGTILTYSCSSTVEAIILARRPQRVVVSEGRPLLEGVALAHTLAQAGIPVTLVTEAQLGEALREAQAALVGADAILPDGTVLNKVGTSSLALLCRRAGVPFLVAADSTKLLPPSPARHLLLEEGEAEEVAAHLPPLVEVRNRRFDLTPGRWVSAYLTEEGVMAPSQWRRLLPRAVRAWRALLGRACDLG
jgi:translation initiation factor 2B subunit (eIF-2B alpha/beta/delta family)